MLNAVDEEEPNEDLLFVLQTRAMSEGFRGLDEVNVEEVFEVRAQVMKTVHQIHEGRVQGIKIESAGDCE